MKLDLLLKKFEFTKQMYLNSEGTPSEKEWEKKLMDCMEEMKKWQTSHRNNARVDYGAQVLSMYHLYENGLKMPENTKEE